MAVSGVCVLCVFVGGALTSAELRLSVVFCKSETCHLCAVTFVGTTSLGNFRSVGLQTASLPSSVPVQGLPCCVTSTEDLASAAWNNETWAPGSSCPGQCVTSAGGAVQNTAVFRTACPVLGLPGALDKTIPHRPSWLGVVCF